MRYERMFIKKGNASARKLWDKKGYQNLKNLRAET
jgi:hypothetical protein